MLAREIRQGLLNRQARTLAPDRIQNVSLVRNLFHRASGLVEVRIETAGDSSTEGMLSALSVEDAEALLTELNAARRQAAAAAAIATNAPPPPPILRLGAPELLAYGFSAGGLGLAILLMAVGSEVLTVTRPDEVNDLARAASPTRLVGLGVLAIAASWTFSALRALVRHHGFTLTREPTPKGPGLRAVEGLFTRREVSLSLNKVQLVSAVEPLMRRLMGYGTVSVETAGFTAGENGLPAAAEVLVPMVEQERLGELFTEAVPAALNPKIFFGYFSVCADPTAGHGHDSTYPGLDWGQSAEALLWLGRRAEVLASWDYVKSFLRADGLIPFAINPSQAGTTAWIELATYQQKFPLVIEPNGGIYKHWFPGNPLFVLANTTFLQMADVIYRHTGDDAWLAAQRSVLRPAVFWWRNWPS